MAIKASGPLKFSDIINEFGRPTNNNLGAFRVSKTVGSLSNLPLDTGIPGPGQPIKFSHFYSKKLNVVVNFFTRDATRENASRKYDDGDVVVIGGFRGRPRNTSGTKVIIHVNKTIGSNNNDRNNVALKTGNWDSGTTLVTIIGPNGKLMGAGGDGGNGGSGSERGQNGTQGTSAFGIQYSTTVVNQGLIFGGRGGGGGGGGSEYRRCARNQRGCDGGPGRVRLKGGGGAGGRGFPIGSGGKGGSIKNNNHESKVNSALKFDGTDGNPNTSGQKGTGIFGNGTSAGYNGTSGNGGNFEESGQSGTTQNNKGSSGAGGSGGQRGYAIIVASGANLISYSGGGEIGGDTKDPGNPGWLPVE